MKFELPIVVVNAGELYATSVDTGRLQFYGDEPIEKGGAEKVTIRLNLEKLIADGVEKTIIYKDISLEGNLDDVQKSRLLLIADKCPVHKTLTGPIEIQAFPVL